MRLKVIWLLTIAICLIVVHSCQEEDVIVQSLFDLSGAPIKYDDSKATKFLNVATVCLQLDKNKAINIQKVKDYIKEIKDNNPETELIVFGETITGWYIYDANPYSYLLNLAEEIPGNTTNEISSLAKEMNVNIVFGLTEIKGDKLYNSQVLINDEGELAALHRKVNLTPEDKINKYQSEDLGTNEGVTIAYINGIKTAMIICADVSSYGLTKKLTNEKVELVLHSMASDVSSFTIDPVARQFNAWIVFANRYGDEDKHHYSGTIYVSDPAGFIRTNSTGKEGYLTYKLRVR